MARDIKIKIGNEYIDLHITLLHREDLKKVFVLEKETGLVNSDVYVMPSKDEHFQISENGIYIGIFAQNKLIGYKCSKIYKPGEQIYGIKLEENAAYFVNSLIHQNFRGNNLQSELLIAGQDAAISRNCTIIYVTVSPLNIHSVKNLEKFGFSVNREAILYGGKKRYIMEKKL